jgi:hypothetical protein
VVRPVDVAGQLEADSAAPAVARPERHDHRARRWGLLLVVGWLVQAGLRAWLSRTQTVPLATPDEAAYLIAARVLAGGVPANFSYSTLYPAGYPLLITPVYWFTHNPVTVYRAALLINAPISAAVMPLAYLAGRRLRLGRPAAYGVAAVAALLPAALFYSEYAMTDAIYPVLVLGWLLAVHSWLTAFSRRGRYAAAIGSALLAGYADAVHSRGLVIVVVYVAVGVLIAWRRLAPRGTVVAAAVALGLPLWLSSVLNGKLAAAMYPSGSRSLAGQVLIRLHRPHDALLIAEQAGGQMWRFVLDGWGVAGIGLVAAVAFALRRGARTDLRIMAAISVVVTLAIAVTAPAALPPTQSLTWASGRYLDCMVVSFFVVGAAVLLRADRRRIVVYAAWLVPPTLVTAVAVFAYSGGSVPTAGFGAAFAFAEPAVLTQDWTQANVFLATAVAFGLLAVWVGAVFAADRWVGGRAGGWVGGSAGGRVGGRVSGSAGGRVGGRAEGRAGGRAGGSAGRGRGVVLGGLGVVSLAAVLQMTSTISQASIPAQEANTTGLVAASGLKPGEHLAVDEGIHAKGVSWESWMPQAFEIGWTQLEFFNPATGPPPANATVVEMEWLPGQTAQASWPNAPAGWRIVASDQTAGWVAWRR